MTLNNICFPLLSALMYTIMIKSVMAKRKEVRRIEIVSFFLNNFSVRFGARSGFGLQSSPHGKYVYILTLPDQSISALHPMWPHHHCSHVNQSRYAVTPRLFNKLNRPRLRISPVCRFVWWNSLCAALRMDPHTWLAHSFLGPFKSAHQELLHTFTCCSIVPFVEVWFKWPLLPIQRLVLQYGSHRYRSHGCLPLPTRPNRDSSSQFIKSAINVW